jgi:hypothetical protein
MKGKCMPGEASEMRGKGQGMGKGMEDGPMGKPMIAQKEMFAADFPEFDKVEKRVDMLVDSAIAECGVDDGDDNALQNAQSDDAEEELDRVHDDIAGYGDPEDIEDEYSGGPTGLKSDDDDEMYGYGGLGMGERLQLEFLLHEEDYKTFFKSMMDKEGVDSMWKAKNESLQEQGEYHAFFKRMMDEEGISSIGQLSSEEKSSFFSKISAGWKKEKGKSVVESLQESGLALSIGAGALLGAAIGTYLKNRKLMLQYCDKEKIENRQKCKYHWYIANNKNLLQYVSKGMAGCKNQKSPARCKATFLKMKARFEDRIKKYESKLKSLK